MREPQRLDPFDQLINACREALEFVKRRENVTYAETISRGEQRKRIEDALKMLTKQSRSTNPSGRSRAHWTPEQRAAASQQMKDRWAARRAAQGDQEIAS